MYNNKYVFFNDNKVFCILYRIDGPENDMLRAAFASSVMGMDITEFKDAGLGYTWDGLKFNEPIE